MPTAGRIFKEVETLFMDKTCLGLDRFDKGLRNSIRPIDKGVYGKLSDCRRWCPDRKSLGTALFFDDPKNNKGFFYYGPLKICWADNRICGLSKAKPQEGFAKEGRIKIHLDAFLIGFEPNQRSLSPSRGA